MNVLWTFLTVFSVILTPFLIVGMLRSLASPRRPYIPPPPKLYDPPPDYFRRQG